ncbi:transaldolase family protein [Microbacterium sp.]|uniref:transaldolase family protein n=1 Tax=Microbacterium sp. TaxID=51671 RepID=UPI0026093A70|nr:transaldolase family protein [Microbacterium sp.]
MLYLDSADRAQLAPLLATGLFAGVTTNPTILDRAGLGPADLPDVIAWVREQGVSRFYAQATGRTLEELRHSAGVIAELGDDVVTKFVATRLGLTVAKEQVDAGRQVLITAVYHPAQALVAAAAGAQEIAPYVGRATEKGRDGIALVSTIARIAPSVRVLAASLRSADQVAEVAAAGAHDLTVSTAVASALLEDSLTVTAADEFEEIVAAGAKVAQR